MESLVASYQESAVHGMEHFLKLFSFVPDDKLTWTPTPTSKSAIRIAAHTALYAGRFARMIRDRQLPASGNLTEWLAQRNAEEIALTSRTEMESLFRKGTAEVIAGLDSLTPEAIGTFLRRSLPEYMAPRIVLTLEEMPLTPNGCRARQSQADAGAGLARRATSWTRPSARVTT